MAEKLANETYSIFQHKFNLNNSAPKRIMLEFGADNGW